MNTWKNNSERNFKRCVLVAMCTEKDSSQVLARTYLDFKGSIEGHLEILALRVFGKHFLPRLLEEGGVEGITQDHVTTVEIGTHRVT